MRVVHLITDLDVGGAEMMLARLVERLDPARIENAVISLSTKGRLGDRIEAAGVPVFTLGLRPGRPNPFALWRLVRLLRRLRPDVIQTWLYHADLAGLVAGTLARAPKIVWNIRCTDLDPRDHSWSLSVVSRLLALGSRWPAAIVCNSVEGRRAHVHRGYAPRVWEIIPNGVDTDLFRPCAGARGALSRELGIAENVPLVGHLARRHPMKDHAAFLHAAALVLKARPEVQFVAAGRGVAGDRILEGIISRLDLGRRVLLLPERADSPRFLAALDAAVSSSSYGEGFPNVVAEAMACGTPCIVTDVGDSALLVGDTGVVVPPRAASALADGILKILNLPPDSRTAMGLAARARVLAEFSLDRATRHYEELYLRIGGQMASAGEPICVE